MTRILNRDMIVGLSIWKSFFQNPNIYKCLVKNVWMSCLRKRNLRFGLAGLILSNCEGKREEGNLSPEQCIKQACLLTVNSTTTLLTTTTSAILDICSNYKNALTHLLALLQEISLTEEMVNGELYDEVVKARFDVNQSKNALSELNLFMEAVEKVVTSATEASFLAGADYMCTILCERLYSAQKEIEKNILEIKELEQQYLKIQQQIASHSKNKEPDGNSSNSSKG